MRATALMAALLAVLAFPTAQAEEVVYEYDGRKLVADATLAPGKAWSDPVVLMVHGTLQHKDQETIKAMRELLNARGYNTLALNLSLGVDERRGPRDCAVPHGHYHRQALVEIGIWLTWLREHGATKVALFGHSRGGNQVAWYAFERPKVDLIGPVVLLAPTTWDKDEEARRYRERFGHGYDEILAKAQDMIKRSRGGERMPGEVDFLYCDKAAVSGQAFFEYYGNDLRKDTPSLLPGVDRPVLIVAGAEDEVVPDLVKKVNGRKLKHVELKVIEGADHFFRDLYAEEAADLIARFLDQTMTVGKSGG